MKELFFRLIRDDEVVGFEYHDQGNGDGMFGLGLVHAVYKILHSEDGVFFFDVLQADRYIPHDKKEQFTGFLDIDREKLFDNDRVVIHARNEMIVYPTGEEPACRVAWDEAKGQWVLIGVNITIHDIVSGTPVKADMSGRLIGTYHEHNIESMKTMGRYKDEAVKS